jgi:hypothetical protein
MIGEGDYFRLGEETVSSVTQRTIIAGWRTSVTALRRGSLLISLCVVLRAAEGRFFWCHSYRLIESNFCRLDLRGELTSSTTGFFVLRIWISVT